MNNNRSLLFVPAEDKKLSKIGMMNADAYIIDLEDSIGERFKDDALRRTVDFLRSHQEKNIYVRINKNRQEQELKVLGDYQVGFMLPKFQELDDYSASVAYFKAHNVIVLIETPKALMNSNYIASIPWVDSLAFGAEDFTVASNMKNTHENLVVPKSLIALSAKANGKKVYDTPCFQLMDEKILESEIEQAVNLGFDGKLAIHPKQIGKINELFGLSNLENAKHIVEVFEASGLDVCTIDGKVYEQLHINQIKKKFSIEG